VVLLSHITAGTTWNSFIQAHLWNFIVTSASDLRLGCHPGMLWQFMTCITSLKPLGTDHAKNIRHNMHFYSLSTSNSIQHILLIQLWPLQSCYTRSY
jgi:hypothetical protein